MNLNTIVQNYVEGSQAGVGSSSETTAVQKLRDNGVSCIELVTMCGQYLTSENIQERTRALELLAKFIENGPGLDNKAEAKALLDFFRARLDDQPSVHAAVCGILAVLSKTSVPVDKEVIIGLSQSVFNGLKIQSFVQTTRLVIYRLMSILITRYYECFMYNSEEFILNFIIAVDGEKDPRSLLIVFRMFVCLVSHMPIEKHAEDLFDVVACYFPITFTPPPNDPYGITADQLKQELRSCLTSSALFADFAIALFMEKLSSSVESARRDALMCIASSVSVFGVASYFEYLEEIWNCCKLILNVGEEEDCKLVVFTIASLGKAASASDVGTLLVHLVGKEVYDLMKKEETKNSILYSKCYAALCGSSVGIWKQIFPKCSQWVLEELRISNYAPRRRQITEFFYGVLSCGMQLSKAFPDKVELLTKDSLQIAETLFTFLQSEEASDSLKQTCIKTVELFCTSKRFFAENAHVQQIVGLAFKLLEEEHMKSSALNLIRVLEQNNHEEVKASCLSLLAKDDKLNVIESLLEVQQLYRCIVEQVARMLQKDFSQGRFRLFLKCFELEFGKELSTELVNGCFKIVYEHRDKIEFDQNCLNSGVVGLSRCLTEETLKSFKNVFTDSKNTPTDLFFFASVVTGCPRDLIAVFSDFRMKPVNGVEKQVSVILASLYCKLDDKNSRGLVESLASDSSFALALICSGAFAVSLNSSKSMLKNYLNNCKKSEDFKLFKLICDPPEFFSKENGFKLSKLSHQKLYYTALPLIQEQFSQCLDKEAILFAFSVLLQNTPLQIMQEQVHNQMELLLSCLETSNTDLLSSTLTVFAKIMKTSSQLLENDIGRLIQLLFKLSVPPYHVTFRINSLKVLKELCKVKHSVLFPYKRVVARHLAKCVDDPKRLVRAEAAECRNVWLLVSEDQV